MRDAPHHRVMRQPPPCDSADESADPTPRPQAAEIMTRLYERLLARLGNRGLPDPGQPPDAQAMAHIRAAARRFTIHAEQCLIALMSEDHDQLVMQSADVLSELMRTWVVCGVEPEDIWIELDRRTRMGNLLLALNTAERASVAPALRRRPWKIRTTKLP
ncbi:phosphoribosyl-ATP pyrophosphatase [Novacetimonas cocois]|nr:hypothetical protein [Novacetimonas cocois]